MDDPEVDTASSIQAVAAAMVAQFKQFPDDPDAVSTVGRQLAGELELSEADTAMAFDLALTALAQMRRN